MSEKTKQALLSGVVMAIILPILWSIFDYFFNGGRIIPPLASYVWEALVVFVLVTAYTYWRNGRK